MKWNKADWVHVAAIALGVVAVGAFRAPLAESFRRAGEGGNEVAKLPPPEQTVVMSLGYRAAMADLIFSHVLVEAGMHLRDKRLFGAAPQLLRTINELDPKFRDGYRFADAIITIQTVKVPAAMYGEARAILARGTRELPYDQELWAAAGQFLAYLAPAGLESPVERDEWRQEGARYLARACELIGSNENIPYQCYTAANLFSRGGNAAASRAFLEKLLLVSDDPELRSLIEHKLVAVAGEEEQRLASSLALRFEQAWRSDLPFLSRPAMSALGPRFDPFACARAPFAIVSADCATSFREKLPAPVRAPL